jgi:hypothetical protein
MPPGGVLVACALFAIGYVYVGKPVAHGVKKASHAICHVVTLGEKCKAPKNPIARRVD